MPQHSLDDFDMACCDLDLQNLIRSSVQTNEYSLKVFIKIIQYVHEISW